MWTSYDATQPKFSYQWILEFYHIFFKKLEKYENDYKKTCMRGTLVYNRKCFGVNICSTHISLMKIATNENLKQNLKKN